MGPFLSGLAKVTVRISGTTNVNLEVVCVVNHDSLLASPLRSANIFSANSP